jgi:hypothetical protein
MWFKNLTFHVIAKWYQIIEHVGSFQTNEASDGAVEKKPKENQDFR